jgi:hypothetical protein
MWLSSRSSAPPKKADAVRSVALVPKPAPNPPPIPKEASSRAAANQGAAVQPPASALPSAAASASAPPPSAAASAPAAAGDEPDFQVIDDSDVKAAAQTKLPAAHSPSEAPARNPWLAELPPELQAIHAKIASGVDIDDAAIRTLHGFNRRSPKDARGHLLLGRAYLKRYWRSDGLAELATALRIDPSARGAPEVLPLLIHLVVEGKASDTASELIARSYGDEALDALEDAISKSKNAAATQRRTCCTGGCSRPRNGASAHQWKLIATSRGPAGVFGGETGRHVPVAGATYENTLTRSTGAGDVWLPRSGE